MKFRFYAIKLSAIMILIFIIQIIFNNFTELFILNKESLIQPWRFITAIFLHSSAIHLIYNLFALALFGSMLERILNWKKFLIIFFVTGVGANLISFNFYDSSLGASGAIFGIIGALIILKPMMVIWAFGLPMPLFVAGILWTAGDLMGAYWFLVGNPIDNTGNIAHLSGLLFGIIFGFLYRQKIPKMRKKEHLKIDESEMRKWEDSFLR